MGLKLFGTSGIRGDAQILFTNQFCFDIGRTFAHLLYFYKQSGPVAIGMDPRSSSPRIMSAIISGLVYSKKIVFSQGASPTPAINYVIKTASYVGSIMVTGSHIAPNLNGVKFFLFGKEILKKDEKLLEKIYTKIKEKVPYRSFFDNLVKEENKANENYEEMLITMVKEPYPKWKVVVDPGNGAQSDLMPRVLSRVGLEVLAINDELQGGFVARDTETEGILKNLQEKVLKEKANFGVAFDGDGDRVVFVDENGQYVHGDYTGGLIAKYEETKTIVTPISTSQLVDYLGKPVIRTKVGSPFVIEAMMVSKASFGFEPNGGCISGEIMMSRDGGTTTIKILSLLNKFGKSFSNLVSTLPKFSHFKQKVNCPSELNMAILQSAKKRFKGIKIEELDGVKIWLDSITWILFRPSGNAPEFRVITESDSNLKAKNLGLEGINFVKSYIDNKL